MERRSFLRAGAAAAGPFIQKARGANDRIVAGQIGLGARGHYELTLCLKNSGVDVAAVCDVWKPLADQAARQAGGKTEGYQDFRRILDRKDIDAVFVSTPDHWHAPISILACQAGKDVYCEKPLTHCISEGRRMVDAARRYKRVVQTGSQQRSAPHFAKARDIVQSGHIGKVTRVETWNAGNEFPEGCGNLPDTGPPSGLDWDLYLGPAPKTPYNRNRFIWHYRWFWDYSGGMMTDWGAHHLDSIHQIMGVEAPEAVSSAGGHILQDNRETPDYFRTVFEYPGFIATYTYSGVNTLGLLSRRTGMLFHGTKGTLFVDRTAYEVMPEMRRPDAEVTDMVEALLRSRAVQASGIRTGAPASAPPRPPQPKPLCEPVKVTGISLDPEIQAVHLQNWFDCIRTRKTPVAGWEIGHRAVTACHLGVIAQRTGRKIRWDAKAERIIGDAEAERMMTKKYRAPWSLPKV